MWLVRALGPHHRDLGVVYPLDADVGALPDIRGVRTAYDLVLAGRVGEPVAEAKLH